MQRKSFHAFTLIELLVVITIIIILASIAYPVYTSVQERARATQDMSNLRQVGLATQMYLNDNDNVIFSSAAAAGTWMAQLKAKYLPAWKIFQSPFDKRSALENDTNAPISYGLNGNSVIGTQIDKIKNVSAFILFAPAQNAGDTVGFDAVATDQATVYKSTSTPGGTASATKPHGTHSGRTRINALFADLHTESMRWTTFINDTESTADPDAKYRWDAAGK